MATYIAEMTTQQTSVQILVPNEFVEFGLDEFNDFLKGFYPNTKIEIFKVSEQSVEGE